MTPRQWLLVYLIIKFTWLMTKRKRIRQKICISALTGKMYVQELLHGTSTHMFNMLRLKKPAFIMLCDHFRQREWLHDSKHIDVEEKMAMFLMTIGHNKRNRTIVDRFQHSTQTISKCFHEVLVAMLHFSKEMIIDPPFDGAIHKGGSPYQCRLKRGPFRGAVGALDGTPVDAHILLDKQIPFRGRGGKDCFQNVLGVCDFDMRFTYVMAGWEGITHDARVLNETLRWPDKHGFPLPPEGMYYLCDAAYTHTRGFMCPYRNVRYWLADYKRGGPPKNKEEKFNQAHSSLRNVIERTFGVLKARFKILKKMPSYSFRTQVQIVIACMAIHNFLRCVAIDDDDRLFKIYGNENVTVPMGSSINSDRPEAPPSINHTFGPEAHEYMVNLRDQVAEQLFSGVI